MYKEFFGLRANPFNVNPDPRYLYLTRHTEEALACLTYGIQSRKGFVLLTGEVGTGKTTLINKLMEWLRLQQVATAFIFNSRMDVPQLLDFMMADFGIPCDTKSKSAILQRLYNWLLDRYRAGETAVLIIDEAQNLSDEVLEEIRMLTNLETFTEKLLQIVLVGQPELEQRLKQPQLRQLRQRLTLRAKTHPFNLEGDEVVYPPAASNRRIERRADLWSRGCGWDLPLFARRAACHQSPLRALPGERLCRSTQGRFPGDRGLGRPRFRSRRWHGGGHDAAVARIRGKI